MPDLWQMQVNTKDLMDLHLLHKNQCTFFLSPHVLPKMDLSSVLLTILSTGSTVLSVGKYSINAQQGCSSFVSSFLIRTDATKFPPALCPARMIFSWSIPSSVLNVQMHNLRSHKLPLPQKEMDFPVQGCSQYPIPGNLVVPWPSSNTRSRSVRPFRNPPP